VSQQLHKGRQADAQAEHFCGEGMSKPVRGYTLRASGSLSRMDDGIAVNGLCALISIDLYAIRMRSPKLATERAAAFAKS
jgi:hypothetical protein